MFPHKHKHTKGKTACVAIFGIILLATGISWFGNDLGWWNITFPFIPLLIIVIAFGILVKSAMCCK